MRIIGVIKHLWQDMEDYVGAVAMAVMACTLAINVFFRYVLQSSFPWAEELSGFAFLWLAFFATSLAAKQRSHIRVTAVILMLPKCLRIYVVGFVDVLWIIFNVVLIYAGIEVVENTMRYRQVSPVLGVNMVWMYMIVPVCAALMTVRIVAGYWRQLRGEESGYEF